VTSTAIAAPLVVGVDPGKQCGVAVLLKGRLRNTTPIRGDRLSAISGVVASVARLAEEHGGVVVVVEDQFGKAHGGKLNLKALATLFRRRHEWEILCEVYGIPTSRVYPASWQTQLKGAPKRYPDGSKRSTKARALLVCGMIWPAHEGWTDDTADAALIARWYWQQQIAQGVAA